MVFLPGLFMVFLALSDLLKSRPRPEGIVLNMLVAHSAAIFQPWPRWLVWGSFLVVGGSVKPWVTSGEFPE